MKVLRIKSLRKVYLARLDLDDAFEALVPSVVHAECARIHVAVGRIEGAEELVQGGGRCGTRFARFCANPARQLLHDGHQL